MANGKDYAAFGQKQQAVDLMIKAIKESPFCPDYLEIVADIRSLIEKPTQSGTATQIK